MNLKKNLNIATILPYKENYTFKKASAASLWVSEFYKKSKYKENNIIYGHTKSKALSFEYKLKKDRKERLRLLYEFKKKS